MKDVSSKKFRSQEFSKRVAKRLQKGRGGRGITRQAHKNMDMKAADSRWVKSARGKLSLGGRVIVTWREKEIQPQGSE